MIGEHVSWASTERAFQFNEIGLVKGEGTKLGRERVWVGYGVFLREQNTVSMNPHLLKDIHRLFTDRASTDNQWTEVLTREAPHPRSGCVF